MTKEVDESAFPAQNNQNQQHQEFLEALDRSEDQFMSSAKVLNMQDHLPNDEGGVQGM